MKKIIAGMLAATVLAVAGMAHAAQVPPLINFQSVLYDDAGEPIPDGSSKVNFQITDVNGSVLYEENQTLDVVHGMVSAMVGNGLTAGGAPTGGIPLEVFEADAGRYLEVTVEGYEPQATMEIVSVPYALYADKAMGAVDGSIGGDAIKDGAITAKHFSSDALKELGGALVSGDSLSMTTAAQSIGVRPGFSYSGSSNIQGVLTDLDRVMAIRSAQMDAKVGDLQQKITDEAAERANADATEAQTRANADNALQTNIDNETSARITAINNHTHSLSVVELIPPGTAIYVDVENDYGIHNRVGSDASNWDRQWSAGLDLQNNDWVSIKRTDICGIPLDAFLIYHMWITPGDVNQAAGGGIDSFDHEEMILPVAKVFEQGSERCVSFQVFSYGDEAVYRLYYDLSYTINTGGGA